MAAPVGNWRGQLLAQIKAPVTPANLSYLDAWQRAEGGSASNNPFNTTLSAPGATPYNSNNGYPVLNYTSPQQGLQATSQTLLESRYGDIVKALRQGTDPMAAANALVASKWGTGPLVQKILGDSPPSTGVTTQPYDPGSRSLASAVAPFKPSSVPKAAPLPLLQIPATPTVPVPLIGLGPGGILRSVLSAANADTARANRTVIMGGGEKNPPAGKGVDVSTQSPIPSKPFPVKTGSPVPTRDLTSVGAEHSTAGLANYPAHDFMAPAGSPVVAPVAGKIVRFSGHPPSAGPVDGVHGPFGWSIYLQGDDGHSYYLTHLGTRDVKVGQRVGAGSQIATVGDYAKYGGANHVHMGVD